VFEAVQQNLQAEPEAVIHRRLGERSGKGGEGWILRGGETRQRLRTATRPGIGGRGWRCRHVGVYHDLAHPTGQPHLVPIQRLVIAGALDGQLPGWPERPLIEAQAADAPPRLDAERDFRRSMDGQLAGAAREEDRDRPGRDRNGELEGADAPLDVEGAQRQSAKICRERGAPLRM